MFHKLFPLLLLIFFIVSCATDGQILKPAAVVAEAEPVSPVFEAEEAADPVPAAETVAEPETESGPAELILFEDLLWRSSSDLQIVLDKKTPLPFAEYRKKAVKEMIKPTVSEDAVSHSTETVFESESVTVAEARSFLEPLLNSAAGEAPGTDESAAKRLPDKPAAPVVESVPVVESAPVAERLAGVVREVFIIECNDEGWLLDEVTDPEGGAADGLRYNGREYVDGMTLFSFYPYRDGIYLVKLRKPDFSAGTTTVKTVELEIVLAPVVANKVEEAVPGGTAAAPGAFIEAPVPAGGDEPASVLQSAEASAANGLYDAAGIVAAAAALESTGDCAGAASLIEDCIETAETSELDLLYFRLGALYENCAGVRNEKAAIAAYKKIVDYYPVSNYWIDARERIVYLERNFIYIR